MERYNLSAEQIVKLLYRKEINRMDNLDNNSFFDNTMLKKVFGNNKTGYKISWEQINKTEIKLKANLPRILRRY
ncbi:hypothetical protein, partial [Fusobacterium sp.]|uniref:hypothetical protein n=2 Tax=Fusobacterium sp. TaxID=68766 RepID=UPI0026044F87